MIEATVSAQFEGIAAAAETCDAIVGATALQIAARSVAELLGIPYVFVAYCPNVIPSPRHAPPPLPPMPGMPAPPPDATPEELWARDAARFSAVFGAALASQRAARGLPPVDDVRAHVLTDRPWLAADPLLAPWPGPEGAVFQTGAWLLDDDTGLEPELDDFLDAGDAPIYFGFGSMRAPEGLGRAMLDAARALGRRALVSRGWADLLADDGAPDCLAIGEANHRLLFPRVAAVVHHGGAGTTSAAARAGAPQVVVPQLYDQHYFARRVSELGIGVAHAPGAPTAESLAVALEEALRSEVAARARSVAGGVRTDGADEAARRLVTLGA